MEAVQEQEEAKVVVKLNKFVPSMTINCYFFLRKYKTEVKNMEVNHKMLGVMVKRCYETKTPIDVKGATGIGKSWVIKEKAKEIAKEKEEIL